MLLPDVLYKIKKNTFSDTFIHNKAYFTWPQTNFFTHPITWTTDSVAIKHGRLHALYSESCISLDSDMLHQGTRTHAATSVKRSADPVYSYYTKMAIVVGYASQ
jgi:5-methylthioribose kinase